MGRTSFTSVRTRLVLVFILALLPFMVLEAIQIYEYKRETVEFAKKSAEELTNFAVMNEEGILQETQQILRTLSEIPEVVRGGRRCNELLASLRRNYPQYANFGVIRPDGEVYGSAIPLKKPVNNSNRAFFRDALIHREFSIGHFEIGRITGKPSICFGYPVIDGDGKVTSVIYASLDLSHVTKFEYEIHVRTPENSTYVKLDRNGSVLTSYPASDLLGEDNFLEKPVFERISKGKKGTFQAVWADGVERLHIFSPLSGSLHSGGAYVLLAIPMKELFAKSDQELTRSIAIFFVVTLLALSGIWLGGRKLIGEPVDVLVDTSKRMAAGDLSARAGLPPGMGELGQLGEAFDEMAEKLQRREEDSRNHIEVSMEKQELGIRLLSLMNNVPGTVYRGHQDWTISFIGAEVKRLSGYDPEELTSGAIFWRNLIHPEDLGSLKRTFSEAVRAGKKEVEVDYRIIHRDGGHRLIRDRRQILYDAAGRFDYVDGLLIDITESKKTEQALRRSEQLFAAFMDHLPSAAFIKDREGRLLYTNRFLETLLGWENARGKTAGELLPAEIAGKMDADDLKAMNGGPSVSHEKVVDANGAERWFETIKFPIGREDGEVLLGGIALEETGRRRAEEEREKLRGQFLQSQKMEAIGTLAGGVAHDFNNILTVVRGYSDLLLSRLGEDNPLAADVREIRRASDSAASLTRQLLAFSRMQVFQPKVLDLDGLVASIRNMLDRLIGVNIELVTVLGENPGMVKADAGQIEQVLLNLVVNARDAMPGGGRITIETSNTVLDKSFESSQVNIRPGPYVALSVTDTGTGMPPEIQARIFEPFFTTKEKGKGTGLGLATVYGIVKQSNGYIWVYSEPGHGTTFKIYLPRVDMVPEEEAPLAQIPVQSSGEETILVVEDTDMVRNLVREVLTRLGYTVLEVSDGEEALLLCGRDERPIHLLLTDMMMPGMSGPELAKAIDSGRPGIGVLYMSGYTEYGSADNAGLPQGVFFIQKPFSASDLAKKVREALDG